MKATLNEHFKTLKSFRADKSQENALRFAGETKAIFDLLEKHPYLLTNEVFGILEYHAKTGPAVKGLDTTKPRQKRFPTDTMCQAAIELLGNIAANIPGQSQNAITALSNVLRAGTDYTVRKEAMIMMDTLLTNSVTTADASKALVHHCRYNEHPDVRRDAGVYLHTAARNNQLALPTVVYPALCAAMSDHDPAISADAIRLFTNLTQENRLYSQQELLNLRSVFQTAVATATLPPDIKAKLAAELKNVDDKYDNNMTIESLAAFKKAFADVERNHPDSPSRENTALYNGLMQARGLIRHASPDQIDKLQAIGALTMTRFKGSLSHYENQSSVESLYLLSTLFSAEPNKEIAFGRIDKTLRANMQNEEIVNGCLQFMKSTTPPPFPVALLETLETFRQQGTTPDIKSVAGQLLGFHAQKIAKAGAKPGQG